MLLADHSTWAQQMSWKEWCSLLLILKQACRLSVYYLSQELFSFKKSFREHTLIFSSSRCLSELISLLSLMFSSVSLLQNKKLMITFYIQLYVGLKLAFPHWTQPAIKSSLRAHFSNFCTRGLIIAVWYERLKGTIAVQRLQAELYRNTFSSKRA